MRRLPVFLCVDVSESMIGGALSSVSSGMRMLVQALRKDPVALEIGALSIITFGAEAKVAVPLSAVTEVVLPNLRISSGTSLGKAFDCLTAEIDTQVVKTTENKRGDYKPLVFIITDGQPTDDWKSALGRFRAKNRSVTVHAIGCGDDVDYSVLKEITPNVVAMDSMAPDAFGKLFKCVSASVQSMASSVSGTGSPLEDLTAMEKDILRKPTDRECSTSTEPRQVFLPVVCGTTGRHYLLRFKKGSDGMYKTVAAHRMDGPLDLGPEEESGWFGGLFGNKKKRNGLNVAASKLQISLPCPYCGNPDLVHCNCETMVCTPAGATKFTCPNCHQTGGIGHDHNFDVQRSRG